MKIFFDTNVVFSAMITSDGLCSQVLEKVLKEHTVIVSAEVLSELRAILKRKTSLTQKDIKEIILAYSEVWFLTTKRKKHAVEVRDTDDQVILERALGEGAEILITGDNDLLEIRDDVKELKIISPKEFLHTF